MTAPLTAAALTPAAATQTMPGWLASAWAELGQKEIAGPATNPHIRDFFAAAGHPKVTSDEVAWCAAFVGACLERAGRLSARSLLSRDYLQWGVQLEQPCFGAIAVLSRDPDPNAGHIGFWLGETDTTIILLGGNQSDAVTVAAFPKSRLLSYRWPEQSLTAAGTPQPPDAQFDRALAHVLKMEGGYTNDPADPGGPTNFGITLEDFANHQATPVTAATRPDLIVALKQIAPETVRAIYWQRYWTPSGAPSLPPPLALFHFDTAVNMGTGTAVRMLQTALGCVIDGELGPQTHAAAAAANPVKALAAYADLRRRRYRALAGFARFGRGWLARVDKTLSLALSLIVKGSNPMSNDPTVSPMATDTTETGSKWWGSSVTIWGALVTGLAAVLPAIGPAFGIDISSSNIHTIADQTGAIIQAVLGLTGTLTAIYGRVRAVQPLVLRDVKIRL